VVYGFQATHISAIIFTNISEGYSRISLRSTGGRSANGRQYKLPPIFRVETGFPTGEHVTYERAVVGGNLVGQHTVVTAAVHRWRSGGDPRCARRRPVSDHCRGDEWGGLLGETGLLEERLRIRPSGQHVSEYARVVSDVAISVDDDGSIVIRVSQCEEATDE
jgi:hypothetical protein